MLEDEGEESSYPSSSVSRGAFLFNKNSTKCILSGSMEKLPLENDKGRAAREKLFQSCWGDVQRKINDIISGQYDKILDDLLDFISKSHTALEKLHSLSLAAAAAAGGEEEEEEGGDVHHQNRLLPPILEVFTAVLIAGVNMPDHGILFERLRTKIREESSVYAVLLKSRNCNSGMRATLKEIWSQLTDAASESSHQQHHDSTGKLSMSALCSWYRQTHHPTCGAGDGAGSKRGNRPPVIIIIEDFESFTTEILRDLILILSPHLPEFPVVLVLGIATSESVVHHTLPQNATSLLSIQKFRTEYSALTLHQILENVLLTPLSPFKLGHKVLNFLLHHFFFCNLSLANFTQGLKCALMEHFYWQPLALLCSSSMLEVKQWPKMNHGFYEAVRASPSIQRFVQSLEPSQKIKLLDNDMALRMILKEMVTKFNVYHCIFHPLLRCLHHLTSLLPNAPLGRKIHELYLLSLEQNIVEQMKFKSAWSLVKLLGKEEFCGRVSLCIQELEKTISSSASLKILEKTLDMFVSFKQEITNLVGSSQEKSSTMDHPPASELVAIETTGERRMQLQARLRHAASHPVSSVFDTARKTLMDSLLSTFTTYLIAPQEMPLHEAYYFDQVGSLRKHLSPAPRAALQTALSNPGYYLSGMGQEGAGLSSDMPDLCIMYQLHLECGKLINLYDWLQSFISVVEPSAAMDTEEVTRKKGVDPILHARFIQTVAELQLLGFIKPTQRKTDHVQRLTWGSC